MASVDASVGRVGFLGEIGVRIAFPIYRLQMFPSIIMSVHSSRAFRR